MKIQGTAIVYNSKVDYYGNCYWAFAYCDNETGKWVTGTIPHVSNLRAALMVDMFPYKEYPSMPVITVEVELPIREFNRKTKSWKYAGCANEDIANYIRAGLSE